MKKMILMAAIALVGCSESAGEKAEAEYRIARSAGVTSAEACQFESRIRDAYLADENEHEYKIWRVTAGATCVSADVDRLM